MRVDIEWMLAMHVPDIIDIVTTGFQRDLPIFIVLIFSCVMVYDDGSFANTLFV